MANHYGHEILVENTWLRGARLFVDGECYDENWDLLATDKAVPRLKAIVDFDGRYHTIEVFFLALLTVKIKICVDGKQIGGEMF